MLVELSVMEQRYQAVLAITQDGWKIIEVARKLGVSRQSVHAWVKHYEQGADTIRTSGSRCDRVVSCRIDSSLSLPTIIRWAPR